MSAYLIAVIITALILVGCGDDGVRIAKLEAENSALRRELTDREAERRADLAYWEKQAALAAGCDYLLPLCAESVIAPGRVAQEQGFGGGTSWFFWLIAVGKLLALFSLWGVMVGVAGWAWARFAAPELAAVAQAQQLVADAEHLARQAVQRAAEASARTFQIECENQQLQEAIEHAEEQLQRIGGTDRSLHLSGSIGQGCRWTIASGRGIPARSGRCLCRHA
jgi:hypothetical protein